MADRTYTDLATAVLVAHQREENGGGCLCGRLKLGQSWAAHVAQVLDVAGALKG